MNMQVNFKEALSIEATLLRNTTYDDQSYSRADTEICLKSKASPEKHLELMHQNMKIATNHKCELCDKIFSTIYNKGRHMKNHRGGKTFLCNKCAKSFGYASELLSHEKTHSGEKPFNCSECKKSFTEFKTLKVHSRLHSGEKSFACADCTKMFSYKSSLKNHIKTHTGERPFDCNLCKKTFIQACNRNRHKYKLHFFK